MHFFAQKHSLTLQLTGLYPAAMQVWLHVSPTTGVPFDRTPNQIPGQPAPSSNQHRVLPDTDQPPVAQPIINPKRGTEEPFQPKPPLNAWACGSQRSGRPCWSLDVRVAVLIVTVAGALILLLLYKLLRLRHRLKLARARHALEYYSFYHSATYRVRDSSLPRVMPTSNGNGTEFPPAAQPETPIKATIVPALPPPPPLVSVSPPPPPLPLPPTPVLLPPPPSPARPPLIPTLSIPPTPPLLTLPLPLPVIHTTPPSPHPSWGASSDAEVYSRIGAFRPSRLSSLSSTIQVILFEHSSL